MVSVSRPFSRPSDEALGATEQLMRTTFSSSVVCTMAHTSHESPVPGLAWNPSRHSEPWNNGCFLARLSWSCRPIAHWSPFYLLACQLASRLNFRWANSLRIALQFVTCLFLETSLPPCSSRVPLGTCRQQHACTLYHSAWGLWFPFSVARWLVEPQLFDHCIRRDLCKSMSVCIFCVVPPVFSWSLGWKLHELKISLSSFVVLPPRSGMLFSSKVTLLASITFCVTVSIMR